MPLIAIIFFIVCVVLFVLLTNVLANRKQIKAAYEYGKTHFNIELPKSASTKDRAFHKLSDAEAFFTLITSYVDDLSSEKRKQLKMHIDGLKETLKIDHKIYDLFITKLN